MIDQIKQCSLNKVLTNLIRNLSKMLYVHYQKENAIFKILCIWCIWIIDRNPSKMTKNYFINHWSGTAEPQVKEYCGNWSHESSGHISYRII